MKTLQQFLEEQIEEAKEAEDLMNFEANQDRIIDAVKDWLKERREKYVKTYYSLSYGKEKELVDKHATILDELLEELQP